VAKARTFTTHVGFTAMDATRAERGFLYEVIAAALESGASAVALCDSAGVMTPFETAEFIKDIRKNVPAVEKCYLGVELADTMKMATACAAAAVEAGACVVKTSITSMNVPRTEDFAAFMKNRGESMGLTCALHTTELERAAAQLKWMLKSEKSGSAHFESSAGENKTHGTGHRAGVALLSQRPGDLLRQRPVIGADAAGGVVQQRLPHHGKAPSAALFHAPAGGVLHLMAAGGAEVDLVQALLLEEHRVSQMGNGTGERPVGTHRADPAVGGQTHEAAPVFEVA